MTEYPEDKSYRRIVTHYENCLERHGDTHLGVDWPNPDDAATRYAIMLGVIRDAPGTPASVLDFGCGAGHLLDYIQRTGRSGIEYRGLDISEKFIALCREKFPDNAFTAGDILDKPDAVDAADYVVANGVFTEKRDLTQPEMLRYMQDTLRVLWPLARKGLAFNVMSKQVDWERDDLFHLSFDELASYLTRDLTRHFVLRQDYGLYEYTAYLYRTAAS
jgi:SAM-dependent methyltransferase